jgi:hypothetical protein
MKRKQFNDAKTDDDLGKLTPSFEAHECHHQPKAEYDEFQAIAAPCIFGHLQL